MTAVIHFGEILAAVLLGTVLFAVSPLGLISELSLFGGGIVTLTLAEYHTSCQARPSGSHNF
jgi:hypothetical protein